MQFFFQNVIPVPLQSENLESSEVWGKEFTVNFKERYFLSSASGKGKSTLLNILYGLRKDYSGSVLYKGKKLKDFSLAEWAKYRRTEVAYLPQNLQLIHHQSVEDNLQLKNSLTHHFTKEEINGFLEQLGIAKLKDRRVNTLSLGQQQRVALVRTLLQPFRFLLLDEPFSHIDNKNIQAALELIETVCEKQKAGYMMATLEYDYGIKSNHTIRL